MGPDNSVFAVIQTLQHTLPPVGQVCWSDAYQRSMKRGSTRTPVCSELRLFSREAISLKTPGNRGGSGELTRLLFLTPSTYCGCPPSFRPNGSRREMCALPSGRVKQGFVERTACSRRFNPHNLLPRFGQAASNWLRRVAFLRFALVCLALRCPTRHPLPAEAETLRDFLGGPPISANLRNRF